jgi:hypothetical protein
MFSIGYIYADSFVSGTMKKHHFLLSDTTNSTDHGLKEFYTITGKYVLSVDGVGSMKNSYSVIVNKPSAESTVFKAFLLASSTGESDFQISETEIRLDDKAFQWDNEIPGAIHNYNYCSDVTSIIKDKIDSSASGHIFVNISEKSSDNIDGTILAVIFEEPSQIKDTTIVLLFGAQKMDGDTFSIILNEKIDFTANDIEANMGLGISFGYQSQSNAEIQYSIVKINGNVLTSSAGGQDDGDNYDGSLLTVGGINDSNDNPSDPNEPPTNDCRIDDELYSLLPFLKNGDTTLSVFTINPSNDDNIFFAYFELPPATLQVCNISDEDHDGVINLWDKCPDTPQNSCVHNDGCACDIVLKDEDNFVSKTKWKEYYVNVDKKYSKLTIVLKNLSADLDLYVRKDNKPTMEYFDCRPFKGGLRSEMCTLINEDNTLWHFSVYGYESGNFSINATAKRN